ncbi:unnamed protein product [Pleuronectes platessa]|uniref:Uncharacterized protein n=1 Tax=Pleuronectes platessa TaxID=8262 RepID=A0A9N7Z915_PLEPL|nr:unnamed protein product [Pleuronectes platessa]
MGAKSMGHKKLQDVVTLSGRPASGTSTHYGALNYHIEREINNPSTFQRVFKVKQTVLRQDDHRLATPRHRP